MSHRVLSALTLELAAAIERDLLRRDDIHLVAARSIEELVSLARDGAALCLVEPLLPDGDALDALDALRALEERVPVVLVTPRDTPRAGTIEQGFAAVLQMPDRSGSFAEVIGRLLGAPRRGGERRVAIARVRDEGGAPLGRVVDLSLGGFALRTRQRLAVGDTIALTIELVAEDLSLPARAEVVRIEGDGAAFRFLAQSAELSSAIERTLAAHFTKDGFSFQPTPELGARAASIGGTLHDGPALTALVELMLEPTADAIPARLTLHELAPLDERGVDRFIALIGRVPGVELRGCPPWLVGLAARLPSLLGRGEASARVRSMQVALRCTGCADEPLDEARWPAPEGVRAAIARCLERPCYVCGSPLALEDSLELLVAVASR